MKPDSETQKVLSEGRIILDFTMTSGWKAAKKKLMEKLISLDSVAQLDFTKAAEDIANEIKLRYSVNDIIVKWIQEIEGIAEQAKANTPKVLEDARKESLVVYE